MGFEFRDALGARIGVRGRDLDDLLDGGGGGADFAQSVAFLDRGGGELANGLG